MTPHTHNLVAILRKPELLIGIVLMLVHLTLGDLKIFHAGKEILPEFFIRVPER